MVSLRTSLPSSSSFKSHSKLKEEESNNTSIQNNNSFIQTPRHSLKNSRANSKTSSPSISNIKNLAINNMEIKKMEKNLKEKDEIIRKLKQEISEIKQDSNIKIENEKSKTFALECKLKDIGKEKNGKEENKKKINKEMIEMDRIIRGLNEENAKLTKQLKEERIDIKQSQKNMYKENQKINDNLISTQKELSQLQQDKIEELQPFAFNEIQKLRKQIKTMKYSSTEREREIGFELRKLKEENRELQFKLNGIDKTNFENETDLIKQFKKEAFKIQKKSENEINELKRKLKWYIENQDLIENLNKQIKQKNHEIYSLKSSQTTSKSTSKSTSPSTQKNNKKNFKKKKKKPTPNEHRQIVSLKKKVKDLEKILLSKHPDSIVSNLITLIDDDVACDSDNDYDENENNIIIKQLRKEIKFLKQELNDKEDETISRLRGLKQQNDKVQLQLNEKIKNLQQEITKLKREKGFLKPNKKIKELQQEIKDLKHNHIKKVKLLKDKYSSSDNNNNNNNNNNNDNDNNIKILENKLKQKESMINNLEMTISTQKQSHNDLKTQICLLQTQLKNTINKYQNINNNDNDYKMMDESISNESIQKKQKEIEKKEREKKEIEEKEKLYIEKIKIQESEIMEYKKQCEILKEKLNLETVKCQQSVKEIENKLEWNKLEQEKSKQLINKLEFELNHLKNTPNYVEYETLLLKLEKIEKRGNERERELESGYIKLLQTNDDIEEKLTKKYESIIKTKNQQIKSLQNELSVLMTAFEKLKSH